MKAKSDKYRQMIFIVKKTGGDYLNFLNFT